MQLSLILYQLNWYLIVQGLHNLADNFSIHTLKYLFIIYFVLVITNLLFCSFKERGFLYLSLKNLYFKINRFIMHSFQPVVFYEILLGFLRPYHNRVTNDMTLQIRSMMLFVLAEVEIIGSAFPINSSMWVIILYIDLPKLSNNNLKIASMNMFC